jgi:AbrB family looped-hinge helix DNA binding protein
MEAVARRLEGLFKVRISSKGQIVIPKNIREALNLRKGEELILMPMDEGILMKRPSPRSKGLRGLLKGLDVDLEECEAILVEARKSLAKAID